MRRLLVLGLLAVVVVGVSASHDFHVSASASAGHTENRGWLSSLWHSFNSAMPWSDNLGHDSTDTLHKVEHIYTMTHENAQRRVDDLKENIVKSTDIQKAIADIYLEEAMRAEKMIEDLKHPMFEWISNWHRTGGDTPDIESATFKERLAAYADSMKDTSGKLSGKFTDMSHMTKSHVEDLSQKIVGGYRSALDQARTAAAAARAAAPHPPSWKEAKRQAAQLYSDAFHKGHGEARTTFGKFRDMLGFGMRGSLNLAKNAAQGVARGTFSLISHFFFASLYAMLGAGIFWVLFGVWRRRQFRQQLDSHVTGPVTVLGEYVVLGNEDIQRKFYEYWSGPAAAYWARQNGLRKHVMHRGVDCMGGNKVWMSYSEWASIEDLRRATRTQEYALIQARAPKPSSYNMTIFQTGNMLVGDEATKDADLRGLRLRGTASSMPVYTATATAPLGNEAIKDTADLRGARLRTTTTTSTTSTTAAPASASVSAY